MKFLHIADLHLRADTPRCRRDLDWMETQETILSFIAEKANEFGVPVFVAGDIYHTPQVPPKVTALFLRFCARVQEGVSVMPGNHDLPYHSWENVETSSYNILLAAASITDPRQQIVSEIDDLYDAPPFGEAGNPKDKDILFRHMLVFRSSSDLPPNVEAFTAPELLAEYPGVKFIFLGDNHHAFHYFKNGRGVYNPGCMTRQAADFKDYRPVMYLIDTKQENPLVEVIGLPDTDPVVEDSYLKVEEEREGRIGAFVESVRSSGSVTLNFADNIEAAIKKNRKTLEEPTIKMIRDLMGTEEGK